MIGLPRVTLLEGHMVEIDVWDVPEVVQQHMIVRRKQCQTTDLLDEILEDGMGKRVAIKG